MNLFLFHKDEYESLFYAEGLEPSERRRLETDHGRVRLWLQANYLRLRDGVRNSEGGVGRLLTRTWERLQALIPADESMLRSMRHAKRLVIHYPAGLTQEEAQTAWCQYLKRCRRARLLWLAPNVVLASLSVVLMMLPGPNILGYWFAFRVISHVMVLLGIRAALGGKVPTEWHASDILDGSLEGYGERVDLISRIYGLKHLAKRFGRSGHPVAGRMLVG